MNFDKNSLQEKVSSSELRHLEELLEKSKEIAKLKKENEILRQYYDLDKEPSDEIKMKIHIDLEINRLKEEKNDLKNEILRLTEIYRSPVYIPQPYYGYPFGCLRF